MLVSMAATSYVGLHRFCRISRHNSPFAYTLGWNILLKNLTVGGLFGYDSSNVSKSLNVPSSNGVSAGNGISKALYVRAYLAQKLLHSISRDYLHKALQRCHLVDQTTIA